MSSFYDYNDYYSENEVSPYGLFDLANSFASDISRQGILGIFGDFTPVCTIDWKYDLNFLNISGHFSYRYS